MLAGLAGLSSRFDATAMLVGDRIDLRRVRSDHRLASHPLMIDLNGNGGLVVVFRYGVLVFFGTTAPQRQEFLAELSPAITQPDEPAPTTT